MTRRSGLLATVLLLVDASLPVVVPAGFTVIGAVVGWTGEARRTRDRAAHARLELRYALVAYLQVLGTMAEFDWRRPDPAMLR